MATFEWKDNEDCDADDWDEQMKVMTDHLLAEAAKSGSALRRKVDPRKLGIVGHSLGGSVAVLAAARDRRFKALAIFGPGGKQDAFLSEARKVRAATIAIDDFAMLFFLLLQRLPGEGILLQFNLNVEADIRPLGSANLSACDY